jgi:hypothetical protein
MQGNSKGFWGAMREAFQRGRSGLPPWRNAHGAAEVNEFLRQARLYAAAATMRQAYASAKGRRDAFGSAANESSRRAAPGYGEELNEADRAWARNWTRYARSPDMRTWNCHPH